mmetsp:Transcript_25311/g.58797  ORF Transcript_25311/g.58797 Transcript_25311/m.58797 type:complete len:588 (+) Transcript_25311:66-1829(+)
MFLPSPVAASAAASSCTADCSSSSVWWCSTPNCPQPFAATASQRLGGWLYRRAALVDGASRRSLLTSRRQGSKAVDIQVMGSAANRTATPQSSSPTRSWSEAQNLAPSAWLRAANFSSATHVNMTAALQSAHNKSITAARRLRQTTSFLTAWLESKWLRVGGVAGFIAALQRSKRAGSRRFQSLSRRLRQGLPIMSGGSTSMQQLLVRVKELRSAIAAVFLCLLLYLASPRVLSRDVPPTWQSPLPTTALRGDEKQRVEAMEQASKSMVSVSGQRSRIGGPWGESTADVSSAGWLVHRSGVVVTSYRAVAQMTAPSVSVRFADQTTAPAVLQGVDKANNLAVLKVRLPSSSGKCPAPALKFHSSVALLTGQDVYVLGDPGNAGSTTLSRGILSSGKGSTASSSRGRESLAMFGVCQIDVPVDVGNEGGPVLNSRGQVIGMAVGFSSDFEPTSSSGLLVPSDAIARSIDHIMADGAVRRPTLDLYLASDDAAAEMGLPHAGAVVVELPRGGAAAKAGLQEGDVVTKLGDTAVKSVDDVVTVLDRHKPLDTVQVTLRRPVPSSSVEDDAPAAGPRYQTVRMMVRLGAAG